MNFNVALAKTRIITGRLLVLFRWKKNAIPFQDKIKTSKFKALNLSIPKTLPLSPLPKNSFILNNIDIEMYAKSNQSIISFKETLKQMMKPKMLKKIVVSQKHIYLDTNEYTLYASKTNNNRYSIKMVSIYWCSKLRKANFTTIEDHLKKSLLYMNNFSLDEAFQLQNYLALLHKIYLIGMFVYATQELIKFQSDFSYELEIAENYEVNIKFSDGFLPFNQFHLFITSDHVVLKSKSKLFISDPQDMHFNFLKREINLFPIINLYYYEAKFRDFDEIDINQILSNIRDKLIVTKLMNLIGFFQNSFPIFPPLEIMIDFHSNLEMVNYSYIEISFKHSYDSVFLKIDSKSGDVLVLDNDPFCQNDLSCFSGCFNIHFYKIFYFLRYFIVFRVLNYHFRYLQHRFNDVNLNPLNGLNINAIRKIFFIVKLSFAPNYQVLFKIDSTNQDYLIASNDFEIHKFNQTLEFFNDNNRPIKNISDNVYISKNLLACLQLIDDLKKLGYKVKRNNRRLEIIMNPLMVVKLKIKHTGFWSISFYRNFRPFFNIGQLVIFGSNFSHRMASYLIHILNIVANTSTLIKNIISFSNNDQSYFIENDLSSFITIKNYCLALEIRPFADHVSYSNSDYFKVNEYISPNLIPRFYSSLPIPLGYIIDHIESFGSFIHRTLPSLVKFREIMNCEGWSTSYLMENESFHLIYKDIITLNIQIRPPQSFIILIPNFDVSVLLKIPLSIFPKLYVLIKLTHPTYKVDVSELKLLRDRVSSFWDDFSVLSKGGFKFAGFQGEDPDLYGELVHRQNLMGFTFKARLESTGMRIVCEGTTYASKFCSKLVTTFSNKREIYRNGIKCACMLFQCEQNVAMLSFGVLREFLKKKWIDIMIWSKFFSNIKVENGTFSCAIETHSYHAVITIQNSSTPTINVFLQNNDQKIFNSVIEFKDWLRRENPLGVLVF